MISFNEFVDRGLDNINYPVVGIRNEIFISELEQNFGLNFTLSICFCYLVVNKGMKDQEIKEKMKRTLASKAHDYSSSSDRYSNFRSSNQYATRFLNKDNHPTYVEYPNTKEFNYISIDNRMSLLILLGTKVSRLKELLLSNKQAKNEPIEDSIIDFMNYRLLLEGFINGHQ